MTGGEKPLIGFIGQGWIGKNYANDFEARGYGTVRYALEEPYVANKEKIAECDIVLIAVPTPTTPAGFDDSIVRSAVSLVGVGKTAVIKSTILPGTTASIQAAYPDRVVLFSPEFLTEATAAEDAAHPKRNIVGMSADVATQKDAAERVLAVLPAAPFTLLCKATEAELIKYGGNCWFYLKIVFVNMLYDLARKQGCDYDVIREGLAADPRIGTSHLVPVHKSGTLGADNYHLFEEGQEREAEGQRGAGGHCFIKDFAAFSRLYRDSFPADTAGVAVLESLERKNIELLKGSGKDLDLLEGVYGTA
jgi:UDPglucose 6-dehydrogenase